MFYREYGPFKGISNSRNNLIQDSNVVEDARNVIFDKYTGAFKKREGQTLSETLSKSPYGIAPRVTDMQMGTEELFIVDEDGLVKADLSTNAAAVLKPFTNVLPTNDSGDYFSYFIDNGVLYFCYGDFIYKYDGVYLQRAGMKFLTANKGSMPVVSDKDYKFLVQIADQENEFACLMEIDIEDVNLNYWPQSATYGFQTGDDAPLAVTGSWYKNKYLVSDQTAGTLYDISGGEFSITVLSHNLIAGDKIFIPSITPSSYAAVNARKTTPRLFEVKETTVGSVTFKNPLGLYVSWGTDFSHTDGSGNAVSAIFSNVVFYPYVKVPGDSVFRSLYAQSNYGIYFFTFNFFCGILDNIGVATPQTFPFMPVDTTSEWEFPEFFRKALPRGKHISSLNGLTFITCPKIWSDEVGIPPDDFEYQTVAWSSENPEDPLETWGGQSTIIGEPSKGRCYATIPNNGALVVFKERSIHTMEFPIKGLTTVTEAVGSVVGCSHPESIKEINGLLFFYVEGKGIYSFRAGGASAVEMTGEFRKFFSTLTGKAKAVVDFKNSRYLCYIDSFAIVFDVLTGSWWIWTAPQVDGGLCYFSNEVVGCDDSDNIFYYDPAQLNDDFGTPEAIEAYIKSSWFAAGNNEEDKKLRALRVWALEGTDPIIATLYANFRDGVSDSVYSETIQNDSNTVDIAGFLRMESGKRKFKSICVKLENNTVDEDLKISGWVFDYVPLGEESKNFTDAR